MSANAIVHFVGLVVVASNFSGQPAPANTPLWQALLPAGRTRVNITQPAARTANTATAPSRPGSPVNPAQPPLLAGHSRVNIDRLGTSPSNPAQNVPLTTWQALDIEPHSAFIAFAAGNYDASQSDWRPPNAKPTWSPAAFNKVSGYKWVALNGQRFEILSDVRWIGTSPLTAQSVARMGAPTSTIANPSQALGGLPLPHLKTLCSGQPLNPGYHDSDLGGAAAFFDLPVGAPSVCKTISNRLDTKFTIPTNGTITIREKATGKKIVLHPTTTTPIYIGNLPVSYLDGVSPSGSLPHAAAYFAMVSGCKLSTDFDPDASAVTDKCEASAPIVPPHQDMKMAANTQSGTNANKTQGFDFQCSNSQWP